MPKNSFYYGTFDFYKANCEYTLVFRLLMALAQLMLPAPLSLIGLG